LEEISAVLKKISKISADEMEWKPVQITAPRGPGMGPGTPIVTYKFWSFSAVSIFVKIHLNQSIMKQSHSSTFSGEICSWTTLAEGPEKFFFNWPERALGDTEQIVSKEKSFEGSSSTGY
jgi:hypothetical protein